MRRHFSKAREAMVEQQLRARGISDSLVLQAMGKLPRELFVPQNLQAYAYEDHPLPIGEDQTISQPYIVALMTQALDLKPTDRVLEVGAGSGYGAAVLASLAKEVYSMEYLRPLVKQARLNLQKASIRNVLIEEREGSLGWPACAPYQAISVSAAAPHIPTPLLQQLAPGGRLVIPVGPSHSTQTLYKVTKLSESDFSYEVLSEVSFVPFLGVEETQAKEEGF